MDDVYERFLTLAQRELSADDVRLLAPGESPPEAENVVVARLADGQHVVASFASPPKDGEALTRRLNMLASTFADALAAPMSERMKSRPPVVISLHEELKALAVRAQAHDVVVIDGDSPVVWGCASISSSPRARNEMLLRDVSDRELSAHDEPSAPAGLHAVPASDDSGPLQDPTAPTGVLRMAPPPAESVPMLVDASYDSLHDPGHDHEPGAHDEAEEPEITRRAIGFIRALPSLDLLHKGRHLRHVSRDESYYLVLSFSSIYLLCMIFDGDFDELRAERAAQESLPRIERLVLALPPLDPDPQPMGGVVALRRPRARR
ncbi:MAG: hypothetical protein JWO86_8523 [Myxococcaceae bacterium]|jgi:hypothetical protein|nr:hypothetical protein [Myxococcaceae bacterium]MEA2749271.1 hypothetical protein [Myxococcales bacterium]